MAVLIAFAAAVLPIGMPTIDPALPRLADLEHVREAPGADAQIVGCSGHEADKVMPYFGSVRD